MNLYERQADPISLYQDADANFSQTRVDEILKSEGFLSPDSGIGHQPSLSSSTPTCVANVLLGEELLKGRMLTGNQYFNHSVRGNQAKQTMFTISASRIDPTEKPGKVAASKSPTQSKESLAILQTRKRLPTLTNSHSSRVKPD